MNRQRWMIAPALAALLVAGHASAAAPESLSEARALYVAASYADALAMLNGLVSTGLEPHELQDVDLYRGLCLVALGNKVAAERTIEAMVLRDPLYRPSPDETPPRLQAMFTNARRRALPIVIQQRYAEASHAFGRQQHAEAEVGFAFVLRLLSDPDLASVAAQPPLAGLRARAEQYRASSLQSLTPPPTP